MRILGFSKKWPKLKEPELTTFRFTRRDQDWQAGEIVQVVYKPRRKGGGEFMGIAEIVNKEPRRIFKTKNLYHTPIITSREAKEDGFPNYFTMSKWLVDTYGLPRLLTEPMNKLTLRWVK